MDTTLTTTKGLTINLHQDRDIRIKDSFARDGYVRVLANTVKGAKTLTRDLRLLGAKVEVLGTRCLRVTA